MPLISVRNLSFVYPDGRRALDSVGFDLQQGERVALVGLNGAGKSTLLSCLAGVLKPEGTIRVEGVGEGKTGSKGLNRVVGLVFQDPNDQLFMPTLRDDVAFGPRNLGLPAEEVGVRVKDALERVGLADYGDRLTHHMSFGERKRAALATILAMQPKLLLLDEPTSNLDPKRRREFVEIMRAAPQAMLIATHDLSMAGRVCSRVLAMRGGKLVYDGPSTILGDKAFLRDLELED